MQEHRAAFEARGAEIVAIGQGDAAAAEHYCRKHGAEFPCLGDEERAGYRAFGFDRTGWWDLTLGPFLEDPLLAAGRIRHADPVASVSRHSDVRQLGGVAIVDSAGVLRFLHRARRVDDLPPVEELIAIVEKLS